MQNWRRLIQIAMMLWVVLSNVGCQEIMYPFLLPFSPTFGPNENQTYDYEANKKRKMKLKEEVQTVHLSGIIVDENDRPLDDVQLYIDWHYLPESDYLCDITSKKQAVVLSGTFDVREDRVMTLFMDFTKKGYLPCYVTCQISYKTPRKLVNEIVLHDDSAPAPYEKRDLKIVLKKEPGN